MEGLEPVAARRGPRWPGVIVAALLTWLSFQLGSASFWPFRLASGMHPLDAALLAMLLGMLVGNVAPHWKDAPGRDALQLEDAAAARHRPAGGSA